MNNQIDFIVCPIDKAPLKVEGDFLLCTKCGAKFKVNEGIPDLIPDEKINTNADTK
jgi:uncharacterized protein YbaR (Trm112 family)